MSINKILNKEQVRNDLYLFINKNIGKLSKENSAIVKDFLLAHDSVESKKNEKAAIILTNARVKIENYIHKAKQVPQTPKIEGNREALVMCLNWLNSDGE